MPLNAEQHRRRRWRLTALLGQQRVTFGLDGLDLSKQQFETIELAADQALQPSGQRIADARAQRLWPRAPVAAQRLVVDGPLREQEALDPIDVLDPFGDQGLALAPEPSAILLLNARRLGHCADPGLGPLKAISVRRRVLPSMRSVLARRRRRGMAIEAAGRRRGFRSPPSPTAGGSRTRPIPLPE